MKNDELTLEKKDAIKELLKITDSIRSSEAVINLFMEQIVEMLKEPEDSIDSGTFGTDGTFNLMKKEAKILIHEEVVVKESFRLLMYPIYHKYLTLEEINELIRFHKTPLGQKLISANPKLMQESMEVGQAWGQALSIKFNQRMSKILKKEI